MDLRTEKTKRSIINAFLELRSHKPLEKISIKELSEKAEINKATFYLHFHDIYDLSERLEKDVVDSCIKSIRHPEEVFRETKTFVSELSDAFVANERLIKILFEGSRSSSFVQLLENGINETIQNVYPDHRQSIEDRMMLTYLIYGGYYTYFKYCDNGIKSVLDIISKLTDGVLQHKDEEHNQSHLKKR